MDRDFLDRLAARLGGEVDDHIGGSLDPDRIVVTCPLPSADRFLLVAPGDDGTWIAEFYPKRPNADRVKIFISDIPNDCRDSDLIAAWVDGKR